MHIQENTLFADRYRLIKLIGSGGFSEVWMAEDEKTGIALAIKIYAPGTGLDDSGIRLFSQEFSLVFNFTHSHLLRPTHYDVYNRMPYLIMPFCEKGSAAKLTGNITEREAWQLLHDVASGLYYLHEQEQPVIHQDIKPENILMDKSGKFMITDFGISTKARSTLRKSSEQYQKTSGGTLAFMAPERFGKDNVPIKAGDIWSVGATLFELLERDTPFGKHGGLVQKSGAEIPLITENYSQELKSIIEKCLDIETWNRPTAKQLLFWSEQYLNGEKVNFGNDNKSKPKPKYPVKQNEDINNTNLKPKRNWFVSFWLWLLIVVNGILVHWFAIGSVIADLSLEVFIFCALASNLFLISLFSAIGLLKRIKLGFWIYCFSTFSLLLLSNLLEFNTSLFIMLGALFAIGVLFAILQIKKNGISAWKTLGKPNFNKNKYYYIVLIILLITSICFSYFYYQKQYSEKTGYFYNGFETSNNDDVVENDFENYHWFYSDDNSWKIKLPSYIKFDNDEDEDWRFYNKAGTFGARVIREKKEVVEALSIYTLSSYVTFIQNSITQDNDDLSYTNKKSVTINGLNAYQFNFSIFEDGSQGYGYVAYIDGDNYYYQIIVVNAYEPQKEEAIKIINSFSIIE
ncbi:MAG: protein kinase [Bacteroidales bacterium]|jgi:hypothetical protein|nr:protein kinase [Bacteroidales bacterium]